MKSPTRLGHSGRSPQDNFGVVNPPVYHASTILFPTVEALLNRYKSGDPQKTMTYGIRGTPGIFAFLDSVAELEGGDRCIAYPSGLAAITGALLAFLKPSDHMLVTDSVYGPTRTFLDGMGARLGIQTTYYDPLIGENIADLIQPNTKVVFTETPGSWTFEVQDIPAIAKAAHAANCVVMLDNTWSGGYYFSAFDHGVDISIQAATKYIGGHSDVMLGTVVCKESHFEPLYDTWNQLGLAVAPDDIYLAHRGMRTMAVRLAQHYENALKIARWLDRHPAVERVLYPALESDPGHALWKRDFTGASGLLGFVLKSKSRDGLAAMLDNMKLYGMGYSWGGFESLLIPTFPHKIRTATAWDMPGQAMRLHAGLEDVDDLIADLEAGLERWTNA